MIGRFASREFGAFVLTGGVAAAVNFGSRFLYDIPFSFSVAIVLAYLTGMATAFVLAKLFVFKQSSQPLHRSALFFTLVNILAIVQTWAVSMALAGYVLPAMGMTSYVHELAHAVGVVTPVFTSYLGHRRWSFR